MQIVSREIMQVQSEKIRNLIDSRGQLLCSTHCLTGCGARILRRLAPFAMRQSFAAERLPSSLSARCDAAKGGAPARPPAFHHTMNETVTQRPRREFRLASAAVAAPVRHIIHYYGRVLSCECVCVWPHVCVWESTVSENYYRNAPFLPGAAPRNRRLLLFFTMQRSLSLAHRLF